MRKKRRLAPKTLSVVAKRPHLSLAEPLSDPAAVKEAFKAEQFMQQRIALRLNIGHSALKQVLEGVYPGMEEKLELYRTLWVEALVEVLDRPEEEWAELWTKHHVVDKSAVAKEVGIYPAFFHKITEGAVPAIPGELVARINQAREDARQLMNGSVFGKHVTSALRDDRDGVKERLQYTRLGGISREYDIADRRGAQQLLVHQQALIVNYGNCRRMTLGEMVGEIGKVLDGIGAGNPGTGVQPVGESTEPAGSPVVGELDDAGAGTAALGCGAGRGFRVPDRERDELESATACVSE